MVGGKWACQDVSRICGEEQICVPKKRDQLESPQLGWVTSVWLQKKRVSWRVYCILHKSLFFFFLNYPNNAIFCQDSGLRPPAKERRPQEIFSGFPSHFLQELNLLSLGASRSCSEASVRGICLSSQSLFSDVLIGFCLVWTCLGLWRPFVKVTQWLPYRQWAQNPEPKPRIVSEILAYLRRR